MKLEDSFPIILDQRLTFFFRYGPDIEMMVKQLNKTNYTDLLSTTGTEMGLLEFVESLASIVAGIHHGSVFTEDPLLGDEWVHHLILLIFMVKPCRENRL